MFDSKTATVSKLAVPSDRSCIHIYVSSLVNVIPDKRRENYIL
jgi:hypothetical protein